MPSIVEKPATIRHPDRDEADDIMRLMLLQAEENSMFDIDPAMLRIAMERAFNYDRTILGVIGSKGDLRGGIMLFVGQPWYSSRQQLQELFNFVHPDHRQGKKSYANDLIDFAKYTSDTMGLPLQIGVISNLRTEAKVKLYSRKLHYVGAFFTYNGHLGLTESKVPAGGPVRPSSAPLVPADAPAEVDEAALKQQRERLSRSITWAQPPRHRPTAAERKSARREKGREAAPVEPDIVAPDNEAA